MTHSRREQTFLQAMLWLDSFSSSSSVKEDASCHIGDIITPRNAAASSKKETFHSPGTDNRLLEEGTFFSGPAANNHKASGRVGPVTVPNPTTPIVERRKRLTSTTTNKGNTSPYHPDYVLETTVPVLASQVETRVASNGGHVPSPPPEAFLTCQGAGAVAEPPQAHPSSSTSRPAEESSPEVTAESFILDSPNAPASVGRHLLDEFEGSVSTSATERHILLDTAGYYLREHPVPSSCDTSFSDQSQDTSVVANAHETKEKVTRVESPTISCTETEEESIVTYSDKHSQYAGSEEAEVIPKNDTDCWVGLCQWAWFRHVVTPPAFLRSAKKEAVYLPVSTEWGFLATSHADP